MVPKNRWWMFVLILPLTIFLAATVSAQNKVVVIPLAPYTPLTADSPPNSAYSIRDNVVMDNVTGLMWQKTDDDGLK